MNLLAVSKGHPWEAIKAVFCAGQRQFGESYLQEAIPKIKQAHDLDLAIEWHFIGRLQANKAKQIARHFAWCHSVVNYKQAELLARHRPANLGALNICLQVNVNHDPQKAGADPAEVTELAQAVAGLPRLRLRGLMLIPAKQDTQQQNSQPFVMLSRLQQMLNAQQALGLDTLSMGMTHDYPLAIAAGATLVRIGSALFGARE